MAGLGQDGVRQSPIVQLCSIRLPSPAFVPPCASELAPPSQLPPSLTGGHCG